MAQPEKPRVPNRPNSSASRIPRFRNNPTPPTPRRIDTSSPAYKQAAARYVRFVVAMPVLLVTSYYLFDRLYLGHEKRPFLGELVYAMNPPATDPLYQLPQVTGA
ncbi:hypothetical protein F5X97DRAFT_323724 [Nemania serpens]|nr:hypothetical protein F5X97DRAFT_323724 [Nemania serpens]